MKPQLKDRECDTVLRGQNYSTIQRVVMVGMEQWWSDDQRGVKTEETRRETCSSVTPSPMNST